MAERHTASTSIRNFIVQKFPGARKKHVADETRLLESRIIDSLGILDVVTFLESSFRIAISDDELIPDNFGSIVDMAAFVERKRSRDQVSAD